MNAVLLQNNQINQVQLAQLNKLEKLCQQADASVPQIYSHLIIEQRPNDSNLLYYINQQLIAFLSVYFFYNDGCEISLLVHPNYRRQKIATQLLKQILPLLTAKTMQRVIFSTSPAYSWLAKRGFNYLESEYRMERVGTILAPLPTHALTIRRANINDIPALVTIDQTCFTGSNTSQHFHDLLQHPKYTLLVAQYQEKIIGKIHIRTQAITFLSDIAILPAWQGQGFGYELVASTINQLLAQGKTNIALDVTTNPQAPAFNLYVRLGFKITLQYDYWETPMDKLRSDLIN